MNYEKIYVNIIENRKKNSINGYLENHHIIPRCLGGGDYKENLVSLTAREHFLCHYLLTKIVERESIEWYKLVSAFHMMGVSSIVQSRKIHSHLYQALREDFSKTMSFFQSGEKNSQFGKRWICNIRKKKNKFLCPDEEIPCGWIFGRNKWKIKIHENKQKKLNEKRTNNVRFYWEKFLSGEYSSLNEFALRDYPYSQPNLIKSFKKYITEYNKIFSQGKSLSSKEVREEVNIKLR